MNKIEEFISIIESEFPADRLTFQKSIPTFHPENAEDAAGLFKLANKYRQKIYITGFGNNIDPVGEPFVNMISVRTDRLNKLIEVAPEDYFAKVGAGYPLRELNPNLAEHNLYLPHGALPYVGSIGGAVAVNLSGALGDVAVPIKKYLIMAEVVTPEGEIVSPGSVCFKSVSGYDVVKVYASSWGLLGLLVSLTFRVMPDTGAVDFADFRQQSVERGHFLSGLDDSNAHIDAVYCRKIKNKFDPLDVFPVV